LTKEETIDHLFRDCIRAKNVWFGCALGINFNSTQGNFSDWLLYCISTLKLEDLSHLAAIIYGIWFARNQLVFDNKDTDDIAIIERALNSIRDYQKANLHPNMQNNGNNNKRTSKTKHNQRANRRPEQNINWKKPRSGYIKANCDANLRHDGSWGIGAIFRDNNGQILASATWENPGFDDAATAEAFALYLASRLAAECCFTRVDFESDNSTVVNLINDSSANPRSYLGNLVKGIRTNRARFQRSSFSHIDRKANCVAHELAALAHLTQNCIWMEETHPTIVSFVLRDLL
jgi:hypothetical protein